MPTARTLRNGSWRVELDPAQIFPRDPGNGTPVMVYGHKGSGTYNRVTNEGTVDVAGGEYEVPEHIVAWLCSDEVTEAIDKMHADHEAAHPDQYVGV